MVTTITVANGDGIGVDIMPAVMSILKESGAALAIEYVEVGESQYKKGYPTGMSEPTLQTIAKNKFFLKGPITTPQGKGFRSINVTIRKTLGLSANVRRCRAYSPYVHATCPKIDVVIVRENEEDLYTGVEYRQTFDSYKAIKTITKGNSTRIAKYAFEYAKVNGRKTVACCVKDNIMKMTDGNFCQCFQKVAADYPDIRSEQHNVDIAAGWLAAKPDKFDVIVTENLYGDILSDIAAEVSGSIGLCSGANIGETHAMFEAVHGSAPSMAKDTANPSALLLAAVEMLAHMGQTEKANLIYNAWLYTIESGIHTCDIYSTNMSKQKAGTKEFSEAVIANLGEAPRSLQPSSFASGSIHFAISKIEHNEVKVLVGAELYIDWRGSDIKELVDILMHAKGSKLSLRSIYARGISIWPKAPALESTMDTDCYRCILSNVTIGEPITHRFINDLLERLDSANIDVVCIEKLYAFDGKPGFPSLSDV